MKSRVKELLERSIAAMLSAVEIYNKPNFLYRGETFSILAINSWELLFKAKWLSMNNNRINSLYVYEYKNRKNNAGKSKRRTIKTTRSGNPLTLGLEEIAGKLTSRKMLEKIVFDNLKALIEIRDSAIHFYNYSNKFIFRLQELGTANLRNYILLLEKWFDKDLTEYNFYLMPLSFVPSTNNLKALVFNNEEKKFLKYINFLEEDNKLTHDNFVFTLNIELNFTKSKAVDAIKVALSKESDAIKIRMSEEQIKQKYPWDYKLLIKKCKERYSDFKQNNKFYEIKREYQNDERYIKIRQLDPDNPKSPRKMFYNTNILQILDTHYKKSKKGKE